MKIQITKSPTADTRSATEIPTKETLLRSSEQHIQDVRTAMMWMSFELDRIAQKHDFTKVEGIDSFHEDFADGMRRKLAGLPNIFKERPWYQRHITEERHHLSDKHPDDVNLFDVLEQIADCVTAGMARTGKVFDLNLSPELLVKAYQNTAKLIQSNVEVVEPANEQQQKGKV